MLSAVKLCQSSSISGPVATEKPRSAKISASSSITWLTGWTLPCGAGVDRQRHVERLGGEPPLELGLLQRRLARRDRLGHRLAQAVDARSLALPLLGRHAAKRLQQPGHRALLAERGDALRLERGEIRRRLDPAEPVALHRLEVAAHAAALDDFPRGLKPSSLRGDMSGNDSRWPPLSAERDGPTIVALHLFSQVIGKVPTALLPWRNHGWHLTLHVDSARPATEPIHATGRHLRAEPSTWSTISGAGRCAGRAHELPLRPMSVADFHAGVMDDARRGRS